MQPRVAAHLIATDWAAAIAIATHAERVYKTVYECNELLYIQDWALLVVRNCKVGLGASTTKSLCTWCVMPAVLQSTAYKKNEYTSSGMANCSDSKIWLCLKQLSREL